MLYKIDLFFFFCNQRRDYRVLADQLPPKQEYVLAIRMSPIQDQLYRRFLEKTRGVFLPSDLFSTYHALSKVCMYMCTCIIGWSLLT